MTDENKNKELESEKEQLQYEEEELLAEEKTSVTGFVSDLAKVIVVAVIAMLVFRFFIAEPFIVSGSSMDPTYHDNQYLVVNKLGYRLTEPQRGDVIVFRFPQNTKEYFIKRIIGLPNEKVRIDNGQVFIFNEQHPEGKVLDEPYLSKNNATFGDSKLVSLGSTEYYVLGDNRAQSSDSRVWGILPEEDIVGKVLVRVFPPKNFGFISDPSYKF